jgi:hypothetical protein
MPLIIAATVTGPQGLSVPFAVFVRFRPSCSFFKPLYFYTNREFMKFPNILRTYQLAAR